MPTILRLNGYRFYFYSHEPNEPPHIHVDHSGRSAKVWTGNVTLARNIGFNARELKDILSMVRHNQAQFLEAWHGYFSS